jgi:cationic amino acid transporter 4
MLGIGNMVGAGVFLLTGLIAKEKAGPGVVLCYLFAGIAMLLSSVCYAEFSARIPIAGSAYTFTYLTLGELWGFVVRWNVILQRMLGAAAVARGWSSMFDAMFNNIIQNTTMEYIGQIHVEGLSPYVDFVAFSVTIIVIVIASVGVVCLANTNMLFTTFNLLTLVVVIGLGFWKADWKNWSSEALGGFLPYGLQGVLTGTATLFYTFVGFESISSAAEEAMDPATQIPIATIVAIMFTTVIYMCSGAALTLMIPFSNIDVGASFPTAFRDVGLDWAVYLVVIGALFGITTSVLTDVFALPRNIYSMASDGLFFKVFATVHPETQTPIVATVVFGIFTALLASLVDYATLVEFLSIATLSSYTIVAACVIVNRYRPPDHATSNSQSDSPTEASDDITATPLRNADDNWPTEPVLITEFKENRILSSLPGSVVIYISITLLVACTVALSCLLKYNSFYDIYGSDKLWILTIVFLGMMGIFTALFFMSAYEEINEPTTFSVSISIILNIYHVGAQGKAWIDTRYV